jgi:hypothetical protein
MSIVSREAQEQSSLMSRIRNGIDTTLAGLYQTKQELEVTDLRMILKIQNGNVDPEVLINQKAYRAGQIGVALPIFSFTALDVPPENLLLENFPPHVRKAYDVQRAVEESVGDDLWATWAAFNTLGNPLLVAVHRTAPPELLQNPLSRGWPQNQAGERAFSYLHPHNRTDFRLGQQQDLSLSVDIIHKI